MEKKVQASHAIISLNLSFYIMYSKKEEDFYLNDKYMKMNMNEGK